MTSEKIPHKKLLFFFSRYFQNVWLLCTLVTGISQNVVGFWNKLHRHFLYIKNIPFWIMQEKNGSYPLHPKTFHPRTLILNFSSLPFILNNSSFLFNPLDFSFTNSSPPFYPTPCNLFQIICYISYPLNSYSSKWDLLFHTFNLICNISSSLNQSLDFISLT